MSSWQTKRLGDIAGISKGKGLSKEDIVNGGKKPCIHYGELFTKYSEEIKNVTSYTNLSNDVFLSKAKDVLMPTSDVTPRGLATASYLPFDDVIIGGDILVIRPKGDRLDGRFLAYYVTANKHAVLRLTTGSTIFHLYGSDVQKLKINLPEVHEQQQIVKILEVWDEYLENLEQKIVLKEQLKKGLMQQLLTGETHLLGFGDEWKQTTIGNVADVNPGSSTLPDEFLYIDLEAVDKGSLVKKPARTRKDKAPSRAQRVLRKFDVLFQTVRPYQKNNYLFNKEGDYVASTGYAQLRAKDSAKFLYHFVQSDNFVKDVLRMCTGSNYPAITSGDLSRIKIKYPNIDEQEKIEKILSASEDEINDLKTRRKLILDQKKYLLKNLITGKIRTPETLTMKGAS